MLLSNHVEGKKKTERGGGGVGGGRGMFKSLGTGKGVEAEFCLKERGRGELASAAGRPKGAKIANARSRWKSQA